MKELYNEACFKKTVQAVTAGFEIKTLRSQYKYGSRALGEEIVHHTESHGFLTMACGADCVSLTRDLLLKTQTERYDEPMREKEKNAREIEYSLWRHNDSLDVSAFSYLLSVSEKNTLGPFFKLPKAFLDRAKRFLKPFGIDV